MIDSQASMVREQVEDMDSSGTTDAVVDYRATKIEKVYVVLPAYNEEESLPNLLKRLEDLNQSTEVAILPLVINDGSADNTAGVVTGFNGDMDVTLVDHPQNMGLGQAVQTGIKQALARADRSSIIVVMDADDTHDVTLISTMVDKIEQGADIVIASRFVDGGDDSSAPPFRRLLSRGASVVFNTVLPLNNVRDFTSGYRGYRVDLLRKASNHWGETLIMEQGFACMVELLLKLRHWSPRIEEAPLYLRYDRKLGASKLKLFRTIFQYLKLAIRDRVSPPPRML